MNERTSKTNTCALSRRTRLGHALSSAAASATSPDTLMLQHCHSCKQVQYPPREICHTCLNGEFVWKPSNNQGVLLSACELHSSLEPEYQTQLPWSIASVRLDCGPVVLVQNIENLPAGTSVTVNARQDAQGNTLLTATS